MRADFFLIDQPCTAAAAAAAASILTHSGIVTRTAAQAKVAF